MKSLNFIGLLVNVAALVLNAIVGNFLGFAISLIGASICGFLAIAYD